jgi:hypothetical protein
VTDFSSSVGGGGGGSSGSGVSGSEATTDAFSESSFSPSDAGRRGDRHRDNHQRRGFVDPRGYRSNSSGQFSDSASDGGSSYGGFSAGSSISGLDRRGGGGAHGRKERDWERERGGRDRERERGGRSDHSVSSVSDTLYSQITEDTLDQIAEQQVRILLLFVFRAWEWVGLLAARSAARAMLSSSRRRFHVCGGASADAS